ncbi:MAG TPA: hypothetical protein VN516_10635 [Candidatus Baltobacteraceae bacterium]|nr:hypothetical protein [Candidatus Baltobacteraceae bacterium]
MAKTKVKNTVVKPKKSIAPKATKPAASTDVEKIIAPDRRPGYCE